MTSACNIIHAVEDNEVPHKDTQMKLKKKVRFTVGLKKQSTNTHHEDKNNHEDKRHKSRQTLFHCTLNLLDQ